MRLQTLLDIPYGMANGRLLSLDALRPKGESEVRLPVVLWLHGGGWYSGNKRNAVDKHMLDFLVRSGFVVASASTVSPAKRRFRPKSTMSRLLSAGYARGPRCSVSILSASRLPVFLQAHTWRCWPRLRSAYQS